MSGDIELEIGAGSKPDQYLVRVLRSAAGGEPTGTLMLDVNDLMRRRELLEATVLASAVSRRSVPEAEQPVRGFGLELFNALFNGPVYGIYRASLGAAQQDGKRLRVVLRLTAPELAALPWEMLFDPEARTYLCRQEPLVRHVPAPYTPDPMDIHGPLRILALVASPAGLPPLNVEGEQAHLAEALAEPIRRGLIELVWTPEATWASVHARLLSGEWHVLHYIGHGGYDAATDQGVLSLVGRNGRVDSVEADRLADLLGEAQPAPRLVVLNSCSTAKAGTSDLFSSTAAALAKSGINAVTAMQFAISDEAAIAFARGFYTAIAHGRGVDEAARSGRISILGAPRSLEWVTPVLYLRGQVTRLFALRPSAAVDLNGGANAQNTDLGVDLDPVARVVTDHRRDAELRAIYVEARAELRLNHFDTALSLLDDLLTLDPTYADAKALRDTALHDATLANAYARARAEEDAGEWILAAHLYEQIQGIDPGYKDAAERRQACVTRQSVADLQAELRHHAAASEWQAVLDVDAELVRIDPPSSDPDGLAARARTALETKERQADLARRYTEARNAEENADWSAAAKAYQEIAAIDPAYGDVRERQSRCHRESRLQALRSEFGKVTTGRRWSRVLAIVKELTNLDPDLVQQLSLVEWSDRARRELAIQAIRAIGEKAPFDFECAASIEKICWHPLRPRIAVAAANKVYFHDILPGRVGPLSLRKPGRVGPPSPLKADPWAALLRDMAFSSDGSRMATACGRETRIWDVASGTQIRALRHPFGVTAITFSTDGAYLAAACRYKTVEIWPLAGRGQPERPIGYVSLDEDPEAIAFAPIKQYAAVGYKNGIICIYDDIFTRRRSAGPPLIVRHDSPVKAMQFIPDGTRLISCSSDKTVRIWDSSSGRASISNFSDSMDRIALSPDGNLMVAVNSKTVRIYDKASGLLLVDTKFSDAIRSVAFSPDGKYFALAAGRGLRICKLA